MTKNVSKKEIPWVALSVGNVVYGKLLGIFEEEDTSVPSGRVVFYKVRLMEPTEVRFKSDGRDSLRCVTAKAGSVVKLTRIVKTREFDSAVETILMGGTCEVDLEGSQSVVVLDEWRASNRKEWLYTAVTRAAERVIVVQ